VAPPSQDEVSWELNGPRTFILRAGTAQAVTQRVVRCRRPHACPRHSWGSRPASSGPGSRSSGKAASDPPRACLLGGGGGEGAAGRGRRSRRLPATFGPWRWESGGRERNTQSGDSAPAAPPGSGATSRLLPGWRSHLGRYPDLSSGTDLAFVTPRVS
jgi:hypothetical protein